MYTNALLATWVFLWNPGHTHQASYMRSLNSRKSLRAVADGGSYNHRTPEAKPGGTSFGFGSVGSRNGGLPALKSGNMSIQVETNTTVLWPYPMSNVIKAYACLQEYGLTGIHFQGPSRSSFGYRTQFRRRHLQGPICTVELMGIVILCLQKNVPTGAGCLRISTDIVEVPTLLDSNECSVLTALIHRIYMPLPLPWAHRKIWYACIPLQATYKSTDLVISIR